VTPETHQTLRHAAGIILMRVLEVCGGILFVALIPRLMGPQVYGQFSLLQTLSYWFFFMGGMGTASMMTRFVPRFVDSGDHTSLRKLASGMLALRLLSGIGGTGVYAGLAIFLFHAADHLAVAMLALSIGVRSIANLPYTLFLGLNQAARWGFADTARASLVAPVVYGGYLAAGLRGACGGLLLLEVLVLFTGLWWGRAFFCWSDFRVDSQFLSPYLRFGSTFFLSNVLGILFRNSGGLVIYLTAGGFVESGYFTLAFGAFALATQAVRKLLSSFGAHFSLLLVRGDTDGLKLWVERLMKILAIASVLACAGALSCGDMIVRTVIGPGYAPVAPLLMLLSVAGVVFMPGSVTPVLAVVFNLPRVAIAATALQVASFGLLCVVLVPGAASAGACWAVIGAVTVFSTYSVWQIRRHLRYSLKSWFQVIAVGLVCSPLLWAWRVNSQVRLLGYLGAFVSLLMMLRILTLSELTLCWEALLRLRRPHAVSQAEGNVSVLASAAK
jgi:O-antigen/teichoic acid export membrane protein